MRGGYTSAKGTLVGGLDPWPADTLPADSCKAPTITVDPTLSATSGELPLHQGVHCRQNRGTALWSVETAVATL